MLNWSLHGATIGYDGGEDFYQNYVLPETNNTNSSSSINDIACLNEPISPWSNIVYRLNKGRNIVLINYDIKLDTAYYAEWLFYSSIVLHKQIPYIGGFLKTLYISLISRICILFVLKLQSRMLMY